MGHGVSLGELATAMVMMTTTLPEGNDKPSPLVSTITGSEPSTRQARTNWPLKMCTLTATLCGPRGLATPAHSPRPGIVRSSMGKAHLSAGLADSVTICSARNSGASGSPGPSLRAGKKLARTTLGGVFRRTSSGPGNGMPFGRGPRLATQRHAGKRKRRDLQDRLAGCSLGPNSRAIG